MPKDAQFLHTDQGSHGTMVCSGCGKKIQSGYYRVHVKSRSNDWGYVSYHLKCSKDDAGWSLMLGRLKINKSKVEEFLLDARLFQKKWRDAGLLESIEEHQNNLSLINAEIEELEKVLK